MSPTDLLLPDAELAQILQALTNQGVVDPVSRAVTEAEAVVDQYAARYTLQEAWRQRLVRPLAIHQLYLLLGRVPEAHQKAHDAAMAELAAIRDGKFGDLAAADPPPDGATPAAWGSEPNIFAPAA